MRQSKDHHSVRMTPVSSGKLREVINDMVYYTDKIKRLADDFDDLAKPAHGKYVKE